MTRESFVGELVAYKTGLYPHIDFWYSLPGNGAGGVLHVLLDDGNTDCDCGDFCREEGNTLGELLNDVIFLLTEEDRNRLINKFHGTEYEEEDVCPHCGR